LWYPVPGGARRVFAQSHEAFSICHDCPVQLECLVYGLEWERFGVWGGMSENSRKTMRAKLKIAVLGEQTR
jgi:hypothetical protein